ncbi:FUSC family protein [Streptomyces sp. TRM70308]|uniref:FUSC family protein n=1 Tax=Streptomyces sp. TRM70308 TaxID=3131932 RepID=UPI003D091F52
MRAGQEVRREALAVGRAAKHVVTRPGRERDVAVQSLKAALAAWVAWVVADRWLHAPLSFVAPWVAVVLVRSTVYQSLTHSVQQVAAITVGTVLATAGGMALGSPTLALAAVLPVVLLLGNWPKLGDQGTYGATAALFTIAFGEPSLDTGTARVLESLLGAAVGVAVNMLIRPPVYLRSARDAVDSLLAETTRTLTSLADGLTRSWGQQDAREWDDRVRGLFPLISHLRSSVQWGQESAWLNPDRRRLAELRRLRGPYTHLAAVLEQLADYLADVTRTLVEASDESVAEPQPEPAVTSGYARFLRHVAAAVSAWGRLLPPPRPDRGDAAGELERAVEGIRDAREGTASPAGRRGHRRPAVVGPVRLPARRRRQTRRRARRPAPAQRRRGVDGPGRHGPGARGSGARGVGCAAVGCAAVRRAPVAVSRRECPGSSAPRRRPGPRAREGRMRVRVSRSGGARPGARRWRRRRRGRSARHGRGRRR